MMLVAAMLVTMLAWQVAFICGYAALRLADRDRTTSQRGRATRAAVPVDDLARSSLWWRRADAARRAGDIARLGDRELLYTLLEDAHAAVQSDATSSLESMLDAHAVGHLLDRLPERAMAVRLQQHALLARVLPLTTAALTPRLVPDALPRRLKSWIALVETLDSPTLFARVGTLHSHADPLIRLSVARALKHHRDPDAEEMLLIALRDHDWRVRAVAARSLGAIGNASAVPRLAGGLRDVRWWVRFRCGLALAQLGDDGRRALDDARRDADRYAGEMATMISGLSTASVTELADG